MWIFRMWTKRILRKPLNKGKLIQHKRSAFTTEISPGYHLFKSDVPVPLKYNGGVLPEVTIAYETWGRLNKDKSNAVLIQGGLYLCSHAKSHKENAAAGWWEKFVGPKCVIDTDNFFAICTNTLGGCYGSTGPSSVNPVTGTAMVLFDMGDGFDSIEDSLARVKCPILVLGVNVDLLYNITHQREFAIALEKSGNRKVTLFSLNCEKGHDSYLVDINGIGMAIKALIH